MANPHTIASGATAGPKRFLSMAKLVKGLRDLFGGRRAEPKPAPPPASPRARAAPRPAPVPEPSLETFWLDPAPPPKSVQRLAEPPVPSEPDVAREPATPREPVVGG